MSILAKLLSVPTSLLLVFTRVCIPSASFRQKLLRAAVSREAQKCVWSGVLYLYDDRHVLARTCGSEACEVRVWVVGELDSAGHRVVPHYQHHRLLHGHRRVQQTRGGGIAEFLEEEKDFPCL